MIGLIVITSLKCYYISFEFYLLLEPFQTFSSDQYQARKSKRRGVEHCAHCLCVFILTDDLSMLKLFQLSTRPNQTRPDQNRPQPDPI